MAKIYHNGEYVSGGTMASTVNTYYVEITDNSIEHPIIIPEKYYHDEGNGLRPHKLVIRNISDDDLKMSFIYVRAEDGGNFGYPSEALVPQYMDLTGNLTQGYIRYPAEASSRAPSVMHLEPYIPHEFYFNGQKYICTTRYYTNCLYGSSYGSYKTIKIYSEQAFEPDRPYTFILTGRIGGTYEGSDMGVDADAQLTIGTIVLSRSTDRIGIKQETIFGTSKLINVVFTDRNSGVIPVGSHFEFVKNNPYIIHFQFSNGTSYQCTYNLHLFT